MEHCSLFNIVKDQVFCMYNGQIGVDGVGRGKTIDFSSGFVTHCSNVLSSFFIFITESI